MRQVRFSMRSWLGKFCFVLAKYRQIWVASGSSLARSSGLSLMPAMPSRKPERAWVLDSRPCASSMVLVRSKRSSLSELRMPGLGLAAAVVVVPSPLVIEGEVEVEAAVAAAALEELLAVSSD